MCSNDLQVDLLFSRCDIDGKQRVTRMAWTTTPLWEKVSNALLKYYVLLNI
ncbi:hypothetical protein HanIR_Chr16g0822361 [Helianthus annuus]|nr:hypothetical protein HanIR_Chr16g0822361 [Helianthus annuus]